MCDESPGSRSCRCAQIGAMPLLITRSWNSRRLNADPRYCDCRSRDRVHKYKFLRTLLRLIPGPVSQGRPGSKHSGRPCRLGA
jgi:hypothetical protein